jgi:hypothetical protein
MKKMPSRIFVTLNAIVGIALLVGASPTMAGTLARCPFDNEVTTLTREGATFIRYALGLRGNALTFGALKLTLASNSYAWDFVPAVEGVVVDSGTASCR